MSFQLYGILAYSFFVYKIRQIGETKLHETLGCYKAFQDLKNRDFLLIKESEAPELIFCLNTRLPMKYEMAVQINTVCFYIHDSLLLLTPSFFVKLIDTSFKDQVQGRLYLTLGSSSLKSFKFSLQSHTLWRTLHLQKHIIALLFIIAKRGRGAV